MTAVRLPVEGPSRAAADRERLYATIRAGSTEPVGQMRFPRLAERGVESVAFERRLGDDAAVECAATDAMTRAIPWEPSASL